MTTETSEEFDAGTSPLCVVSDDTRVTAIEEVITHYGEAVSAKRGAIAWGTLRATNAYKAGESAHRSIKIGMQTVDEYANYCASRITGEPRRMLHEIACTRVEHIESNGQYTAGTVASLVDGQQYRVRIEPVHEPVDLAVGC